MPEENQTQTSQVYGPVKYNINDRLSSLRSFRESAKLRKAQQTQNTMDTDSNTLYEKSLNVNNKELSKKYNMASQSAAAASMIKSYAERNWDDWSDLNTPQDVLTEYFKLNPDDATFNKIMEFTQSDRDPEEFWIEMWWVEPKKEPSKWSVQSILNWDTWTWVDTATIPHRFAVDTIMWLWEGTANALRRIWNNMGDIKEVAQSDLPLPEKFNKILLWEIIADDIWGSIWDIIWGWLEGSFRWVTTKQQRQALSDEVSDFVQNVMESDLWQDTINWWNSLSEEQQKEARDYLTYADWLLNLTFLKWGGKFVKPVAKEVGTVVKEGIDTGIDWGKKALQKVGTTVEKKLAEKSAKKWAKEVEKVATELDDVADKIWRGKTTDVKNTIEALKEVDTSNVKTFKDLNESFETSKKDVAKKIDEALEKVEGKVTKEDLAKVRTKEGKYWPVEYQNRSIADAFDDLRKLYEVTNDREALAELEQMEKYFYENWFTKKEANDFARTYWNEFKNKAFNKDWSRKVSGVWEGYENTREQIKDLVREDLPDDTVKNLDKRYSQLSNTQKLIKKTVEEVNAFNRDLKKKWLMSKIWGWLASLISWIDTATTWGLGKGFVSKLAKLAWIASNDAGKMSIDEVEKQLPKLLKRFKDLNTKLANAEGKEAQNILKQAEKDFAKSSKNWDWLSKEIIDNWGITFDLKNNINLWGQDFTSVSPYPNRTLIIPKEELTDQTIKDYARKNMSAIMRDWHALWGWVDENGKVYLDVAVTLPNKYKGRAIDLWKKYNQKAVFDLKNFEEIPAWWNWNVMEVDENVVWNDIKDFLK